MLRYFVFVFSEAKCKPAKKNTGGIFYYFIEKHMQKNSPQVVLKENKVYPKKSLT